MRRFLYVFGVRTRVRNFWARITARFTEYFVDRRLPQLETPSFTLVCVYRSKNADHVSALINGVQQVRLWALDDEDTGLASATIGRGPGTRADLLNSLVEGVDTPYVVLADDDIRFEAGDISRLVTIAHRFQFDLSQPAMSPRGFSVHQIVIRRGLSVARRTNFVEVGPVVVIAARLRDHILPLPEEFGPYSYGLDVKWMALCDTHQARFGVVDGVLGRHMYRAGTSYEAADEVARFDRFIAETGGVPLHKRWRNLETFRPWQL